MCFLLAYTINLTRMPCRGTFGQIKVLKSPPAGDLGGEIRLMQLPQVIMRKRKRPLA